MKTLRRQLQKTIYFLEVNDSKLQPLLPKWAALAYSGETTRAMMSSGEAYVQISTHLRPLCKVQL